MFLVGRPSSFYQRRTFFLCIAKAFWNHRHCRWFSLYKKSNRKFSLRFEKEETGSEEKRLREQRGLVPSWSFLTCLRRPYLFPCAGKDRGEKGRLVTVWCILPLNSGGYQCFGLAFHTGLTLRASWYAPPDTGVSNLQLVSVEYLPSIEGALEIQMNVTFLRGKAPLPGADSPYQGEMSRRDKRGRDAVSAQPRLRGCCKFA